MDIGKKLLEYRYKNNYSQKQVAYFLDISQSTYCDWESDTTFPNTKNLLKIARFYNIDVKELLTSENFMNTSISKNENSEALLKISETLEKLVRLLEKIFESKL